METGHKVIIIGDTAVGKTSICKRYVNNEFSFECTPTIGCDNFEKTIEISGKQIKLSIWDTAGQERFRGLASSYYKRAFCVIIVFGLDNQQSFNKLGYWKEEIDNFSESNVLVVVVGNKSDIE